MALTGRRRVPGDEGGVSTTAGRSAVARVASCSAMAALPVLPRCGAEIIRRADPPQSGQQTTSGRLSIGCICCVVPHPVSQRKT
uniref:Uncharacterized protein n=2 Tax=unclassified Mycobacterium TaxID=2642494 RepID=A0A5Q5BJA1_MYCSS